MPDNVVSLPREVPGSSFLRIRESDGPASPIVGIPGHGLISARCHRVDFAGAGTQRSAWWPLQQVVRPGDELSFAVLPEFRPDLVGADRFAAAGVTLELVLANDPRPTNPTPTDPTPTDPAPTESSPTGPTPEVGLLDRYGVRSDARSRARSQVLLPDQWNLSRFDLSALAGRVITGIEISCWLPDTVTGGCTAFVDAVRIGSRRDPAPDPTSPADHVRTTRGSNSSYLYSRGNTAPLVGLPHGFMMGSPITRPWQGHWIYSWFDEAPSGAPKLDNRDDVQMPASENGDTDTDTATGAGPDLDPGTGARGRVGSGTDADRQRLLTETDGRSRIGAFATSLLPSPWIGERAAFQVMPGQLRSVADAEPEVDPRLRSLPFSHDRELDRPHHYRVEFDADPGWAPRVVAPLQDVPSGGGIIAELTPLQHGLVMRFAFPDSSGTRRPTVLFDFLGRLGELEIEQVPDGARVRGWVDAELERVPVVPRLYVSGLLVGAVDRVERSTADPQVVFAVLEAVAAQNDPDLTPGAATAEFSLGTSFISLADAERHRVDDGAAAGFDAVRDRARRAWDEALGVVRVEDADEDRLVTLYSGLYRLFLYPNVMHEPDEHGRPRYASPFRRDRADGSTRTGLDVVDGELTVNQGYWDTYRTCWPALQLMDPAAGALLDGMVQQYRDSGWTTRWSAPGHVDVMVGTSSDVIFADAALRGTPGFDLLGAYDSAVRNATALPDQPAVGRKGLHRSQFLGYTPDSVAEGLSWTMEAAINDFGIARYSELLVRNGPAERRAEFEANARWFAGRAASSAALFDAETGFFRARTETGEFRDPAADFDPAIWGTDYTETNAWGMSVSVPHDGAGLAALLGGPAALEAQLDAFFATPEVGGDGVRGAYDYVIHEITEARDMRLGMFGLSNQPAHHIPGMYACAGRPDKLQGSVRESLERLYVGSDLGQGCPGDEDNGEMSTWWTLNAIGLYPLVVGEPGWLITSPLFRAASITQPGGAVFRVVATGNGPGRPYIAAAWLDGEVWESVWLPHERVAAGGELVLEMSAQPSDWGARTAPPSLSNPGDLPATLHDLTEAARCDERGRRLTDDDASTAVPVEAGESIEWRWPGPIRGALCTISAAEVGHPDIALDVHGSDGWISVGIPSLEFRWRGQTRALQLPELDFDALRITAAQRVLLTQVEVLAAG